MIEALGATLSQVADRLISLVHEHKRTRRDLFENHIDPIFRMLEDVVSDYFALFGELEREFNNHAVLPSATIQGLIARRQTTVLLRQKISQYSAALLERIDDREIQEFAVACRALLRKEPTFVGQTLTPGRTSAVTGLMCDIADVVNEYQCPRAPLRIDTIPYGDGLQPAFKDSEAVAIVDSSPRELFCLVIRATRSRAELNWGAASLSYYRLKLKLLK